MFRKRRTNGLTPQNSNGTTPTRSRAKSDSTAKSTKSKTKSTDQSAEYRCLNCQTPSQTTQSTCQSTKCKTPHSGQTKGQKPQSSGQSKCKTQSSQTSKPGQKQQMTGQKSSQKPDATPPSAIQTPIQLSSGQNLKTLEKVKWYWGDVTKDQVFHALKDQLEHSFLVRNSWTHKNGYTISVKKNGKIIGIRIYQHQNKFGCDEHEIIFDSIKKLIEYHKTDPLNLGDDITSPKIKVKLLYPVARKDDDQQDDNDDENILQLFDKLAKLKDEFNSKQAEFYKKDEDYNKHLKEMKNHQHQIKTIETAMEMMGEQIMINNDLHRKEHRKREIQKELEHHYKDMMKVQRTLLYEKDKLNRSLVNLIKYITESLTEINFIKFKLRDLERDYLVVKRKIEKILGCDPQHHQDVNDQFWYVNEEKFDQEKAEELLTGGPNGRFLIRRSQTVGRKFAASFVANNRVDHYELAHYYDHSDSFEKENEEERRRLQTMFSTMKFEQN